MVRFLRKAVSFALVQSRPCFATLLCFMTFGLAIALRPTLESLCLLIT